MRALRWTPPRTTRWKPWGRETARAVRSGSKRLKTVSPAELVIVYVLDPKPLVLQQGEKKMKFRSWAQQYGAGVRSIGQDWLRQKQLQVGRGVLPVRGSDGGEDNQLVAGNLMEADTCLEKLPGLRGKLPGSE